MALLLSTTSKTFMFCEYMFCKYISYFLVFLPTTGESGARNLHFRKISKDCEAIYYKTYPAVQQCHLSPVLYLVYRFNKS